MPKAAQLEKTGFDKLKKVIDESKGKQGMLLPVMQAAQEIFGYLPLEVQKFIAENMDVPLTRVYGIASFYTQFVMKPQGEKKISVCLGTACYVRGAQQVLEALKEHLNVEVGDTTDDGLFTLEATRCLGCCGLAPVMMINDDVYGRLSKEMIPEIISKYRK